MPNPPKRDGPLEEHLTVRVDRELAEALDEEQRVRELVAGIPVSRAALIRALIRIGISTCKHRRDPS